MKKFTAIMMALVLALGLGSQIALADRHMTEINPQQQGHIAYLNHLYGEKGTQKVLSSYRANKTGEIIAPVQPHQQPNNITEGVGIIIPTPQPDVGGGSTSDLTTLRVGDYFVQGGKRYVVIRFSTVANAAVLVANLVNAQGFIIDTTSRYFYL